MELIYILRQKFSITVQAGYSQCCIRTQLLVRTVEKDDNHNAFLMTARLNNQIPPYS